MNGPHGCLSAYPVHTLPFYTTRACPTTVAVRGTPITFLTGTFVAVQTSRSVAVCCGAAVSSAACCHGGRGSPSRCCIRRSPLFRRTEHARGDARVARRAALLVRTLISNLAYRALRAFRAGVSLFSCFACVHYWYRRFVTAFGQRTPLPPCARRCVRLSAAPHCCASAADCHCLAAYLICGRYLL